MSGAWPNDGPLSLARLPQLIAECERRWDLRVGEPYSLSYNYVARAVRSYGTRAVLKLGVPNPEFTTEIAALEQYGGQGAVRVLASDAERGFLLLEEIRPGTPLAELEDDDEATAIAAGLMRRLWLPLLPEHPYPDLRRWTRSLTQYHGHSQQEPGPLPRSLVDRAVRLLDELLASAPLPVLIHGDFHHWNVLRAEREPWLVIDPKGVAAEPAFEVGPFLYNPMPQVFLGHDLEQVTQRRIDLLVEHLVLDRQRVIVCAFVATVLSMCWSVEEGGAFPPGFLALAEILARA